MKVKDLIKILEKCDENADVEVRGDIDDRGYIAESVDAVDDCGQLVILDI